MHQLNRIQKVFRPLSIISILCASVQQIIEMSFLLIKKVVSQGEKVLRLTISLAGFVQNGKVAADT